MRCDDVLTWRTRDGETVFAWHRGAEHRARAALCLVHGIGEHSGRYEEVVGKFNAAGISVYSFDLRGHGESGGRRGHTPSYASLLDDLARIIEKARGAEGETCPVFVWGHSMGGNIALNHALLRKPPIAGLVVTAPYLRLGFEPSKLDTLLARIMNVIAPRFSIETALDTDALSRVPGVGEAYRADPLTHGFVSARWFVTAQKAAAFALSHAAELRYPLLLMHGNADRITSVGGSREFAASLGDRCTYREFDGAYHELHNDTVKDEAYREILSFIERVSALPSVHAP